MLKPGGRFVLSVPYSLADETIEHFPQLAEFEIITVLGERCLVHKRNDGTLEIFNKLKFHGGVGQPLEMRVFCLRHLLTLLEDAGFTSTRILEQAPEWGVLYDNGCSRTILGFKE